MVRAGEASIQTQGAVTLIRQSSERAVIDWRSFSTSAAEAVNFAQPSSVAATLNRVTGAQASVLMGQINANGAVFLVNPHGVIIGGGAQINVGSFIASTANISDQDFMARRLAFSSPGDAGANIVNQGGISVAEGGLLALVAPSVRNDGVILARLGKVALAAGDTFTLDLYGDQLINLAVSPERLASATGSLNVAHSGSIEAAGGQVLLVTASAGKGVLDDVINLSGTIRADSVGQQGGKISLLGLNAAVNVSGELTVLGQDVGERGGQIDVRGTRVSLADGARLDASGQAGGGTVHLGGDWQGRGNDLRADTTSVATGARISADALQAGNGGEVVVWSDEHTAFAGEISARGGALAGDGGRVEVSGKQTLDFSGNVDASATNGLAGSLLLDPAILTIGLTEAALINRVLRTGTSTSLQADVDINLNAMIDGRGRIAGGGLTMTAGSNININNYLVTNNGRVNLNAGGNINVASGYGVFSGTAPLYARAGGNLANTGLVSSSLLHLTSTAANVAIDTWGIDAGIGDVVLVAANDVNISQPVINLKSGRSLSVTAGQNINVNAQIDGSDGVAGGAVSLSATAGSVNINEHVVTNNGAITVHGGTTVNQLAAGTDTFGAPMTKQLRAGNGTISVSAGGHLSPGSLVTSGAVNVTAGGNLSIDVPIYETVGNATLAATGNIDINQVIANTTSGANSTLTAGGSIDIDAKLGPWDRTTGTTVSRNATPGGQLSLSATGNININTDVVSYKGALTGAAPASISMTSTAGQVLLASGKKVISDGGTISISSFGNLQNADPLAAVNAPVTMGYFTTGALNLTSTNGNLTINQTIPNTTGVVTLSGGNGVSINQRIYTNNANLYVYAGLGGITMSPVEDPKGFDPGTGYVSDIDTRYGSIYMESQGPMRMAAVRTAGTLTLKATDPTTGYLFGCDGTGTSCTAGLDNVYISRNPNGTTLGMPSRIDLAGAAGIQSYSTSSAPNVHAISTHGSVDHLFVDSPGTLEIVALKDIIIGGSIGNNVSLYAGRDIPFTGSLLVGNLAARAGRNLTLAGGEPLELSGGAYTSNMPSIVAASLNFSAGSNPFTGLTSTIAGLSAPAWQGSYGSSFGNISSPNHLWVEGSGGVTMNATRDITLPQVHVGYDDPINSTEAIAAVQFQQPFSLSAGRNISLTQIETIGPVSLSSTGGNITVSTTIGPNVTVVTPANDVWNPLNRGVASASIIASGPAATISIKEIRATGDITVAATYQGSPNGIIQFANEFNPLNDVGFQTSTGTVRIYDGYNPSYTDPYATYAGLTSLVNYYHYVTAAQAVAVNNVATPDPYTGGYYDYVTTISATPKARLPQPNSTIPALVPGPTLAGPGAPAVAGALPPGAPGAASVAGAGLPALADDALPEIFVAEPVLAVTEPDVNREGAESDAGTDLALAGSTGAGSSSGSGPLFVPGSLNPLAFNTSTGAFLVFGGGRGESAEEEDRQR